MEKSSPSTPATSDPPSKAASLRSPAHGEPLKKDRAPAFVVVLCLFQSCAGWESGVISGMINQVDYLRRFGEPDPTVAAGYSIPTTRQALITSFLGLGALFGSLIAGKVSAKVGTKVATLISLVIFLIGVAIELSCHYQWGQILAGRWIAGFGIGSMSMLAPAFQAECSPRHLRGTITSTFQLACTLGIFLSNVVNYCSKHYTGAIQWRIPLCISMIFGAIFGLGTILSPESPRFYLKRGNEEMALKSLSRLRDLPVGDEELQAELEAMAEEVRVEQSAANATYWDCFKSADRMRLRTTIGIMVQAGQQWTGVNFFFSYGVKFFQSAGITDSFKIQVILSAVNVASTFPGLWAVENLGRRNTLFIGSIIMFIGQVVAGALGTAYPDGEVAGKILIAFSCIFIFGFAASWGPLGWVVASEQFPLRMAPYCVAFATGANWFNNWLLAMITPYITDAGYGNLQAKITKGLSLGQVEELYLTNLPAWRTGSWSPYGDNNPHADDVSHKLSVEKHEDAGMRELA
ncbi:MFS transporter, SP family, sugar:H+ symporter, partial [Phenoliferia sp. Uapishka_3]